MMNRAQTMAWPPAAAPSNDNHERRIARREMVVSSSSSPPRVDVEALFECSPVTVYRMLVDFERLPEVIRGLESATILSHTGTGAVVRFTMRLPPPIGQLTWTNLIEIRQSRQSYGLRWSLVDGDLVENRGELLLTPFANDSERTHARYRVQVQTRSRLPASAQRLATRWLLPRVLKTLRRRAESR